MRAFLLTVATLFVSLATLSQGPTPLSTILGSLPERFTDGTWNALIDERLPRLLVVLMTGSALAVSGAVTQALFSNPLASPGILGLQAGSSLAVTCVLLSGCYRELPLFIPLAAVLGSLATLLLVYSLARRRGDMLSLVLCGLALSALLLCAQQALIYASRHNWTLVQTIAEWEACSTSDRDWQHVWMQLPLTVAGLAICWRLREEIDVLSFGEEEALNLGVETAKARKWLFLAIAMLVGGCLAGLGNLPFFGLLLPHVVRQLSSARARFLLPNCFWAGGLSLSALDVLLRGVHFSALSIGHVSALLGSCFFLLLITKTSEWKRC